MTGNNEDFWREMLEDGAGAGEQHMASQLQNQASQRAVQAVRDLYRIDEDDQQSVRRAWVRLTQRMQETAVEQDVSTSQEVPEMGMLFTHPGERRKTRLQQRWALLAACLTAFLLLGSFVSLLVILPQRGNQQGARTGTALPTQQGTQATQQIGTRLGNITLGEPIEDVIALFYPFQPEKGANRGSNLLYLRYTKIGIEIVSSSNNHVIQIAAWAPFTGATAEHFTPGMSFSQFTRIYPQFTPMKPAELNSDQKNFSFAWKGIVSGVIVGDGHSAVLRVFFDANQTAVLLILQSGK